MFCTYQVYLAWYSLDVRIPGKITGDKNGFFFKHRLTPSKTYTVKRVKFPLFSRFFF